MREKLGQKVERHNNNPKVGQACANRTALSRSRSGRLEAVKEEGRPWAALENKTREYAAEKVAATAKGRAKERDVVAPEIMSSISLNRFTVKGPPKLLTQKNSQQAAIAGAVLNSPLFIVTLRVWLRSYIIFAVANIAEEVKPWATLIHTTPSTPAPAPLKTPTVIAHM